MCVACDNRAAFDLLILTLRSLGASEEIADEACEWLIALRDENVLYRAVLREAREALERIVGNPDAQLGGHIRAEVVAAMEGE